MQLRGWSLSHSILPSVDNVSFYHSFVLQLCHNWQYCWSVLFNIYVCTLAKSKTDGDCGEKSFSENYRLWGTTWSCSTCSFFNTATQLNYFAAARTWISVCQAQGPVRQKRTDHQNTLTSTPPLLICSLFVGGCHWGLLQSLLLPYYINTVQVSLWNDRDKLSKCQIDFSIRGASILFV